jgi:DNA-binding NtrC family response regulator
LASRERALSFDERERRIIEQALEQPGGNRVNAARILGITWEQAAACDQETQSAVGRILLC